MNGINIQALKAATSAKKFWEAKERALKSQLLQDSFERAKAKLRAGGKEHGTVNFDIEDGGKVKIVLKKERVVNDEDVERVLRNRPDLAKHWRVSYALVPKEKDLAAMDPDTRALLLECTTTKEANPSIEVILGQTEEEDE